MRVRQITGTKLAAQIASKTRFGWYKTWPLAVTGWLILLTASAQSPDIVWMRGIHLGSVNSVVVSPDGTLVASASGDGTVKLWRMSDGLLVRVLRGHRRGATCVAFSPNGSLLASGGVTADNNLNDLYEIKLWRVSDGSEVRTLTGHTGVVTSVAFSPDGTLLASGGGYRDRTIRLWRVSDGALMRTLPGHAWGVTDIAFSPDGSLVASGSAYYDVSDRGDIKLWRVSDGSEVRHIRVDRAVSSIAFSPDGGLIASGNGDGTVKLWRVLDGVLVLTLTGHRRYVYSLAFSPDGNLLASGGWDGNINLWRMSDGLKMHTLTGHSGRVNSLAFSPDGTLLVSGGSDGIINSWRMSDGLKMHTLTGHNLQVNSLAFSPDGTLLASASGGIIKLWRVSDGSEVRILRGHTSTVGCVAFSPDGSLIASGADDGIVILWSTSSGAQLINLRQRGSVFTVAFSSDSSTLASVSSSEIKFWRVPDGSEVRTISGSGTLSPDGSLVASGYNDGTIKLWRVSDGSEVRTFTGHRGAVTRVAFSPDGTLLASASTDRTIKLWRLPSGDLLQNYDQVTSATSIHFSPDGQLFVYADSDALVMARSPFVSSNRPPAIPGLIQPEDGATVSQTPVFRVGLSDPDGDQVKAIIEISDASGVVRTLETSLVASGSEASVSVAAEQPLAVGSYTWRARAQDSNGNLSDWSAARALSVAEGVPILLQGVRTFALIGAGVSSPDSLGLGGVELVRWDASAQRYSRVSQLQPGEGYFVKATTPVQTVLRGDPITGEFTLQLRPGWNLIAIPTLTAVAWDLDGVQVQRGVERKSLREAQRAGWVEDYLWGWQQSADDPMSGQYQLVYDARILPPVPAPPDPTSHEHPVYGFASVLKPFQAYWIFARESCALVLNSERGRAAAVAPVSDSSAWVLQIEAVRGSGVSNSVWIGIAKGRSWHAALAPAPPQGEPPVQVRVRRQEGSFAADLRSAMDRDTRWHIEVVVAPSEQPQPITLRVNNLTRLPRGVNLALIDEQSGARRPLRMAASSLSFTAPAEGGVFRFAIEPISQRALLRVLNPTVRGGSRSGEAITLGFTLTTEAQTQVQIRAGSRTVRTLSDHRTRSAGLQEFVWDGRDDSGTHLPPGAYTAEITAISSDGQTARVAVPILIRR